MSPGSPGLTCRPGTWEQGALGPPASGSRGGETGARGPGRERGEDPGALSLGRATPPTHASCRLIPRTPSRAGLCRLLLEDQSRSWARAGHPLWGARLPAWKSGSKQPCEGCQKKRQMSESRK